MRIAVTDSHVSSSVIAAALGASRRNGWYEGKGWAVAWYGGMPFSFAGPEAYGTRYRRWKIADLPIVPGSWKIAVKREAKRSLEVFRMLVGSNDVEQVVIAASPTGEAEYQARLALSYAGFRDYRRVRRLWTVRPLTIGEVLRGMQTLEDDEAWEEACAQSEARERFEWIVGTNLSRLLSLRLKGTVGIGRVTACALGVLGRGHNDSEGAEGGGGLLDLSGAQVRAARTFGLSALATLRAADRLYWQWRAITYPRTGARKVSAVTWSVLKEGIAHLRLSEPHLAPATDADRLRSRLLREASGEDRSLTPLLAVAGVSPRASEDDRAVYRIVIEAMAEALSPDAARRVGGPHRREETATEAGVLAALASGGVGTPVARSYAVDRLTSRGYLAHEEGSLKLTSEGRLVLEEGISRSATEALFRIEREGSWEKKLAQGSEAVLAEVIELLKEACGSERPPNRVGGYRTDYSCPLCGAAVLEGKSSFYCSSRKAGCSFMVAKVISGHRLTGEDLGALTKPGGAHGPVASFRTRAGGTAKGALYYDAERKRAVIDHEGTRWSGLIRGEGGRM